MGAPDSQLGATEPHEAEAAQLACPENSGLQEHSDDNCLYCSGLSVLGLKSHSSRPGEMEEDRVCCKYTASRIYTVVDSIYFVHRCVQCIYCKGKLNKVNTYLTLAWRNVCL